MEFTGERVIPGQVDLDLWNEHVARYAFAASLARQLLARKNASLEVLDAGCGSGYGASLLAALSPAVRVTAADSSPDAIDYARAHYAAPNLQFVLADCLSLPAGLGPFDLVVTFELVEHLADAGGFLAAVARLLAPWGLLVASTPNRRFYTEERAYTNPFHAREYDTAEFEALLAPFFPHVRLAAQNHTAAVAFTELARVGQASTPAQPLECGGLPLPLCGTEACFGAMPGADQRQAEQRESDPDRATTHPLPSAAAKGAATDGKEWGTQETEWGTLGQTSAVSGSKEADEPHFLLAVCGQSPVPELEPFVFVPSAANLLRERERHIGKLEHDLHALQEQTNRELDERKRWAQKLEADIAERDATIRDVQAAHERANEWARRADQAVAEARGVIEALDRELEERTAWARKLEFEVQEKTRWARDLDTELQRLSGIITGLQADLDSKLNWARELESDVDRARSALDTLQQEFDERTAWALRLDAERQELLAQLGAAHADLRLILGSPWYRAGKILRLSPVPACDSPKSKVQSPKSELGGEASPAQTPGAAGKAGAGEDAQGFAEASETPALQEPAAKQPPSEPPDQAGSAEAK